MQLQPTILTYLSTCLVALFQLAADAASGPPPAIETILSETQPLRHPRLNRLPLYVWPTHGTLGGTSDKQCRTWLRALDQRGIAYCADWDHRKFEASLAEGLRIARLQKALGLEISINANACLHSLYDGTEETAHIDSSGQAFWDTSFGPRTGCPFALEHRVPVIRDRIERFVRAYDEAGLEIDVLFADWEIDGPMEWNEAWDRSRECARCQEHLPTDTDFRAFQTILRRLRSDFQKRMFSEPILNTFPDALVGNYGVSPHGGHRYWYDYFETLPPEAPVLSEHGAKHREWAPEFDATGYTMSMPVVYTWYRLFDTLPFEDGDYRWFYNMLQVASNAAGHTDPATPSIPFVHWHTTAPPDASDVNVPQFSAQAYQDLLWHMLLRGHDSFFLWCLQSELAQEIRLVHEVYADSMRYQDFTQDGVSINSFVPAMPDAVVSGRRLGNRVLVKRSNFGPQTGAIRMPLSKGEMIEVPASFDFGILPVVADTRNTNWSRDAFPIGFYEHPADPEALKAMATAGINLVRCNNRTDLDRVAAHGMHGWVSLNFQDGLNAPLQERIRALWDHPALAVWEGPDEIVWTFTAYSFLKEKAGFTREDWNRQAPIAVEYAASVGNDLLLRMRQSMEWLKRRDPLHRPIWINEAADSDVLYARGYVDQVDYIGCDYYAVRTTGTDLQSMGRLVQRWDAIGKQRPVWMVLQGFSWHAIRPDRDRYYPSFAQSRYMAYDSIVHGARALLYWGTETIDDPEFRQSLYALASEISQLSPFLKPEQTRNLETRIIPDLFEPPGLGVQARIGKHASDVILILVNQDAHRHLGVEITTPPSLNGRRLHLLYGQEMQIPLNESMVTRLQGNAVKVFATDPALAKGMSGGRHYVDTQRGNTGQGNRP